MNTMNTTMTNEMMNKIAAENSNENKVQAPAGRLIPLTRGEKAVIIILAVAVSVATVWFLRTKFVPDMMNIIEMVKNLSM